MSYARQLLYSIADQMGRSKKDMDPYIQTLQKNWYDTKDALKAMKQKDFDRLDFPSRLSGIMMEKLGSSSQIQKSQSNQMRNQKMQIQSPLSDLFGALKSKLSKSDFDEVVDLLGKIFSNIRNSITQQKYRTLKKSNDKINKLTSIPEVQKVLFYGGFERTKQGYSMTRISLPLLDECLGEFSNHRQKIPFNPYQQKIISLSSSKMNMQGETSVVFNEMLAQQKKRREQMMLKPVKDRQIKVFQVKPQNVQRMDLQFNEKEDMNEDQRVYNDSLKEKLKNYGKEETFINKRKQEYYDLLKQPLYTETVVRVKLPNYWIFQCKFSPLQTFQALVDIFHENLDKKLDYYLYMTPPVQKLQGALLRQTFYDTGSVPKAIFLFKCEDDIKDNIMKIKKGGFFGLFG